MLSPKQSGELIAGNAKHVTIQKEEINKLGEIVIQEINDGNFSLDGFARSKFHLNPEDPHVLDWIFVINSLDFGFWSNRQWKVHKYRGYFALCAAIDRAIKEGIDILNPQFYSEITTEQLKDILRGDYYVTIPLLHERAASLRDCGAVLLAEFGGSFRNCVEKAQHSALQLIHIIAENFMFFRDEAEYKGSKVAFYKKAQMLVTDIWMCFKNQGIGYFSDINELTVGACYRIPQTLLYYNVLNYDNELWQKIRSCTILENGCEEEVEIRGCSIHAAELLTNYIKDRLPQGKTVNSILIDHFLWKKRRQLGKTITSKELYFHRTNSVYY